MSLFKSTPPKESTMAKDDADKKQAEADKNQAKLDDKLREQGKTPPGDQPRSDLGVTAAALNAPVAEPDFQSAAPQREPKQEFSEKREYKPEEAEKIVLEEWEKLGLRALARPFDPPVFRAMSPTGPFQVQIGSVTQTLHADCTEQDLRKAVQGIAAPLLGAAQGAKAASLSRGYGCQVATCYLTPRTRDPESTRARNYFSVKLSAWLDLPSSPPSFTRLSSTP